MLSIRLWKILHFAPWIPVFDRDHPNYSELALFRYMHSGNQTWQWAINASLSWYMYLQTCIYIYLYLFNYIIIFIFIYLSIYLSIYCVDFIYVPGIIHCNVWMLEGENMSLVQGGATRPVVWRGFFQAKQCAANFGEGESYIWSSVKNVFPHLKHHPKVASIRLGQ